MIANILSISQYVPLISGIIVLVSLLVVTIFYFVGESFQRKYQARIMEKSNSVRVFVIDVAMEIVTYFNVKNLREVRKMKLSDFYKQFAKADRPKIAKWIKGLLEPDSGTPNYLEVDVKVTADRKDYFSMLQVSHLNQQEGIIHIESYLFKYVPVAKASASANAKMTSKSDFDAQIKSSSKNKGASLCLRIIFKKQSEVEQYLEPVLFNSLKNELSTLLRENKRFILIASKSEIIVSDLKVSSPAQARFFLHQTSAICNRFISFNGLASTLEIRIGAVEHRYFPYDAEAIVSEARKCAKLAHDVNERYYWYNPTRRIDMVVDDESSYRTEVERIINGRKLGFYFRPIYSVDQLRVIGYLAKVKPEDAYFSTIEELKEYAARAREGQELFGTIAMNLITTFSAQKGDASPMLYIPVACSEFRYVLTTFSPLVEGKNLKICFVVSEEDISAHLGSMGVDGISQTIANIRAKGFKFALLIGEKLILPEEFYPLFDYFIVSFAFAGAQTGLDTRIRADLHATVEKLLKYKKRIMASDIDGWNAIELLVRSGLNYISAEAFSPYERMIAPVNPKSLKRIKQIAKEAKHI
ncbi:MAG: hypothetical protein Q4F15_04950 [Bacillota bacterium]|nr:hypothetical protein [Bacillota bacterium]